MEASSKSLKSRVRRAVLIVAGAALVLWTALLARVPPAPAPHEPEVQAVEAPAGSLAGLALRNARSLEATRERLANEWQSTYIESDTEDGRVAERFLDSAFVLHAARAMYNRDELQGAEYDRIAADPVALSLARRIAVDAEEAERVFGPDQAFVRVYAVRTLAHVSKQRPEVVAEAAAVLGQKLNAAPEWKKGIEHDYVELVAAYCRAIGPDTILSDPESFMKRIQLTPRTSLEVSRAMWDSGVLHSFTAEQMTSLKAVFQRLSVQG